MSLSTNICFQSYLLSSAISFCSQSRDIASYSNLMFLQMVFSALAFAQSEVLWYFQHVGVASSKSKTARMVAVEIVRSFLSFSHCSH